MQMINFQSSRSIKVMQPVRHFILQCLEFNIVFIAKHVPGVNNKIANVFSRFQFHSLKALVPSASPHLEPLLEKMWSIGDMRLIRLFRWH